MKKFILINLLLMASMLYATTPVKDAYHSDRFLFCLQPELSIEKIDSRSGTPVTGIASLDRLIALRGIVEMEPYLTGATPADMDGDIVLANIYRISIGGGRSDLDQLVSDFGSEASVLYAEKEPIHYLLYSPNDGRYGQQWYLPKIEAPEAWDMFDIAGGVMPGDRAIVLASVDTGVQYTHPDLKTRIWINQDEIPTDVFSSVDANSDGVVTSAEVEASLTDYDVNGVVNLQDALHTNSPFMNGVDDDPVGTTYVDDLFGWDPSGTTSAADADNDPIGVFSGSADLSTRMHGTHVGGILSAATDNNLGMASTVFNGSLMCVKVFYDQSSGGISNGGDGILYAAKAGADIINLSWGGPGYSASNQAIMNLAHDTYGSVIVAGAGNGNDDGSPSDDHFYPAGYENVLSVTAVGSSDNFSWANYGVESGTPGQFGYFAGVDIAAPGEGILSTVYTSSGSYQSWPGTSMASPLVASAVGLLKSANPSASNDWLVNSIINGADPIDQVNPDYAGQLGSGRVNVFNSMASGLFPSLSYDSYSLSISGDNGDGLLSPGESAHMRVNLYNESGWQDALGVTAILRCNSDFITILDSTASYNDINNGNIGIQFTDRYQFSVAADAPSGEYPMSLTVTANTSGAHPYTVELEFSIDVSMWQLNFPIASSMIKGGNAVVDLDGDGTNEIIYTAYDSLLHAVNASGSEISGFPVSLGYLAEATPSVGDIDNDGDLEIVVGSLDRNLYVVQHDGSAEAIYFAPGFILAPATLYDLDGDADLEIVTVSYNDELAVMHHDGTPLDNFPMTLDDNMTVGAAVGDINADGAVDIVVGTWGDQLHAVNLDGSEAAGFPVTLGDRIRSAPTLANLDGSADGSLEIIFGSDDNKLHAYDGAGNELWYVSSAAQNIQADPAITDMDGDGDLEVFIGGLDRLIYAVDHNGIFLEGWPVSTNGAIYSAPALADVNADGVAEVFIGSNDRFLYGLYLDGSNIGGFPVENTNNIQGNPSVADLDGDGDVEIIVGADDNLLVMDISTSGETSSFWPTHRGNLHRSGAVRSTVTVEESSTRPQTHNLHANYPNPFNPTTTIAYDIAEEAHVSIQILDIRGRVVEELVSEQTSPGSYSVSWDGKLMGRPANAGVYFYRLSTVKGDLVRKMTLLK